MGDLSSSAASYLEEVGAAALKPLSNGDKRSIQPPVSLIDTDEPEFVPSEPSDPLSPPGNLSAITEPFVPHAEQNRAPSTPSTLTQVAGSPYTPHLEVYPMLELHPINSGVVPIPPGCGDMELTQPPFQGAHAPGAPFSHPSVAVNALATTAGANDSLSIPLTQLPKSPESAGGALQPTHTPAMQLGDTSSSRRQSQQVKSGRAVDGSCGCCDALKKLF